MDTEDEHEEQPEEGAALKAALVDYLRKLTISAWGVVLFIGALIFVDESVGMGGASAALIVPTIVFSVIAAVVSLFVVPASAWEEHVEGKREARRHELEDAVARLGEVAPEEVSLTPWEKLRRVLYDSRKTLLAAVVLEVLVALPFVTYPEVLRADGGGYDAFMTAVMFAMVAPIPLYTAFSLLVDAFSEDTISAADERAERAYREAVKDKGQLVGGLELDEHARRAGGELTVKEQAGGLAIHEEVTLGFDAVDEVAEEDASRGHASKVGAP
jgi:hypothetical protein